MTLKSKPSHPKQKAFAMIEEINEKIPKSAFPKCYEDWKKRWHKRIISGGVYFEGGQDSY